MNIGNRHVDFLRGENPSSPLVLLNDYADRALDRLRAIRLLSPTDFHLAVVSGLDWEADLTPWKEDRLGPGLRAMKGEAERYLALIEEKILPSAMSFMGIDPSYLLIAGYSLAGLFAIYAALASGLFRKAASVSGSLWYPRFRDFVLEREVPPSFQAAYLSYGDKEPNGRNPLLRTVGNMTEDIASIIQGKGVRTYFEINPGNHFADAERRLAKGIVSLLDETEREIDPSK